MASAPAPKGLLVEIHHNMGAVLECKIAAEDVVGTMNPNVLSLLLCMLLSPYIFLDEFKFV